MYDLSSKFNTFYKDHVVLSKDETKRLRELKDLNIERLKSGLSDYNEENGTNYKIVDYVVQGSVAMSTITQNDKKDYDIDVAIIFDKDNLPDGTTATKNIIVDALKRKCGQFKAEPEFKTNCVRLKYAEGYHVDFAIYRRTKNSDDEYEYEHCGSEWRPRDPRAITRWFRDENKKKDYKLRKVVRLLKMFCKSRDYWIMPGGLVQTVLCSEKFKSHDRLDEMFYETIKAIKDRLLENKEVYNPVDDSQSLLLIQKDDIRMENLCNRLDTYLDKLSILFEEDCTEEKAMEAWKEFFNHSFWSNQVVEEKASSTNRSVSQYYYDTEEYIDDIVPVELKYKLHIDCEVTDERSRTIRKLRNMLLRGETLTIGKKLKFYIDYTNVPRPFEVFWKVRNCGKIAEDKDCIRGQIFKNVNNQEINNESTDFEGPHYVECFIIKNGVCVAKDRINVPIKN
ncbi:MAG: hypothetical protein PWQ70_2894 [Clostridiales bacterium]|jgi:hypothetical protein|nr:hypothetical protein [Clostridiales bacterium]